MVRRSGVAGGSLCRGWDDILADNGRLPHVSVLLQLLHARSGGKEQLPPTPRLPSLEPHTLTGCCLQGNMAGGQLQLLDIPPELVGATHFDLVYTDMSIYGNNTPIRIVSTPL